MTEISIAFFADDKFDTGEGGASPETVALSYFKRECKTPFKVVPFWLEENQQDFDFGIVLESHSHWGLPMSCKAKHLVFIRDKGTSVKSEQVAHQVSKQLSVRLFLNDTSRAYNGVIDPIEVATVSNFKEAIILTAEWISEMSKLSEGGGSTRRKRELSQEQFLSITDCIALHRDNVERFPGVGALASAGEEEHRDSLLASLSLRFADVTAESFSKRGKTDIRLKTEDNSLFFAECKMWSGISSVQQAFDQLVKRYMISRDQYGCLVFFVRGIKQPEQVEPKIIQYLTSQRGAILIDQETSLTTLRIPSTEEYSEKVLAIVSIEVDSSSA